MHIAVSWDISSSGEQWKQVDERLRFVLKPYSWIRPVNTFYVIRVNGQGDREQIKNALVAVARAASVNVNFVVSPLMATGAGYDGYLPPEMWSAVNERTS